MTKTTMQRTEKTNEQIERATSERVYVPRVDIVESDEAFELLADMPGVPKDGVAVSFERGVLSIDASGAVETPAGCRLADSEFGIGRYRRDFSLSDAIDTSRISGRVSQGVLRVTLPKRESVKSRRIEIKD